MDDTYNSVYKDEKTASTSNTKQNKTRKNEGIEERND